MASGRRSTYDVDGRVILITGAAQGIGLALARQVYDAGARLALLDVDGQLLDSRCAEFADDRVIGKAVDVADRQAVASAVQSVAEHYGRIDVVVANAGVTPAPSTIRFMSLDDYDRVIAINQTGVLNTIQPALPAVIRSEGHLVVVSSCAAFAPGVGGVAYMSSKAATEQIGRTLRIELGGTGATAGVAYFGFVDTGLARATLDHDPLGRELDALLGWPLNHRISPDDAARSLARGISRRAASTVAPTRWMPYSMLRGALNVAADRVLTQDGRVHALVRSLDQRGTFL